MNKFYPEEDIIDGFSILCFDKFTSLEKFSNSLQSNIRGISNFKVKRKDGRDISKPTRVTAKRKSKPDISTLSMSRRQQKRLKCIPSNLKKKETMNIRDNIVNPIVIDVDLDIMCHKSHDDSDQLESDSKCNSIKEECFVLNEKFEIINGDSKPKETHSNGSCSDSSSKYCSIVEEISITENSTSSPVSIQPIHFENQTLDQHWPEIIDISHDNGNEKPMNDTSPEMDSNNNDSNICGEEERETKAIDNTDEDDDCMIVSIGFDPDPKLSNITISNSCQIPEDVPQLKPAPLSGFNFSRLSNPRMTIPFSPKSPVNFPKPPPLIPAPAQYFPIHRVSQDSRKMQSHSQYVDQSQRYRSKKRQQMKSSIMKPPAKYVKRNQEILPSKSNGKTQLSGYMEGNVAAPLPKSNYTTNGTFFSLPINAVRPLKTLPSTTTVSSTSAILETMNYNFRLPKPIPLYNTNIIQPMISYNGSYQQCTRKTLCHVHIAQSIFKKLSSGNAMPNILVNHSPYLNKPLPVRPLSQSFNCTQLLPSPLNLSLKEMMKESLLSHKSQNMFNYPIKPVQSLTSLKSTRDAPILIRPLNKTYLSNPFMSRNSNPVNIYPKENFILLK